MFTYFDKIRDAVSGKKTYLLAVAAIITAIVGWSQGMISNLDLIKAIFAAVGTCTLRAGVAKAEVSVWIALILGGSMFFGGPRFCAAAEIPAAANGLDGASPSTNAAPITAPALTLSHPVDWMLGQIVAHGQIQSGVGVNLKGTVGALEAQQWAVIHHEDDRGQWAVGIAHASFVEHGGSTELMGVSGSWSWFKVDALNKFLFVHLAELHGFAGAYLPISQFTTSRFELKQTVFGLGFGWKF